jgi:hypothetical protein
MLDTNIMRSDPGRTDLCFADKSCNFQKNINLSENINLFQMVLLRTSQHAVIIAILLISKLNATDQI